MQRDRHDSQGNIAHWVVTTNRGGGVRGASSTGQRRSADGAGQRRRARAEQRPGLSGIVWQDFCLSDCTAGSSLRRGNGTPDEAEVRLSGVLVRLGRGACRYTRLPHDHDQR